MRLTKFWKKKKKKNPFQASMPLDKPEAQIVEASYKENPFFIGIGLAKKRDVKGAGGVGTQGVKGEYASQKDLDWRIWYNPNALPNGFMPEEKLKDWMAGTVSAVSGSVDVYREETEFVEAEPEELEKMNEADLQDYLARDADATFNAWIEEARKQRKKERKRG